MKEVAQSFSLQKTEDKSGLAVEREDTQISSEVGGKTQGEDAGL